MPMTTEQSLIGGREVNGEPKKLAEVEVPATATASPPASPAWASVICEITGTRQRDPRELRAGEDRLLVQDVALVRGGGRPRPGPAARLRREDGADEAARVDRRRADPQGGAARSRSPTWWCAAWWTSTGPSGPPPRWAGSSGRCPGRARAVHPPALRRPLGARGETMSDDRYMIISADAHAGLPVRGVPALPRRGVPPAVRRVPGRAARATATSR